MKNDRDARKPITLILFAAIMAVCVLVTIPVVTAASMVMPGPGPIDRPGGPPESPTENVPDSFPAGLHVPDGSPAKSRAPDSFPAPDNVEINPVPVPFPAPDNVGINPVPVPKDLPTPHDFPAPERVGEANPQPSP